MAAECGAARVGLLREQVMHTPAQVPPTAHGHASRQASPRGALSLAALAPRSGVLVALLALGATGCGRKATVEDCEQIVRRIAELELRDVVPKEELGSEVQDAQQRFRERALVDCVGRRITEKSLACVNTAKTPEAVIDECFD